MITGMLTQSSLMELVSYDNDSGLFRWRHRNASHFKSDRSCKSWHARYAGKEAGSVSCGYLQLTVMGRTYKAHRLAWLYVHGVWPTEIDHVNHNRLDNRISNLRDVTRKENSKNKSMYANNKSGFHGVTPRGGKWRVEIGKERLGSYNSLEDAVSARKMAEVSRGYHEHHGKQNVFD